jgi:glycosyltransferase involved in cell wall biosynthesis
MRAVPSPRLPTLRKFEIVDRARRDFLNACRCKLPVLGRSCSTVETQQSFSLVTIGGGAGEPAGCPPAVVVDRVVDLGFLPDADRDAAFAAADAYLQPSRNEVFSRRVMEARLAGTPVIADAASDVVAWHCK